MTTKDRVTLVLNDNSNLLALRDDLEITKIAYLGESDNSSKLNAGNEALYIRISFDGKIIESNRTWKNLLGDMEPFRVLFNGDSDAILEVLSKLQEGGLDFLFTEAPILFKNGSKNYSLQFEVFGSTILLIALPLIAEVCSICPIRNSVKNDNKKNRSYTG